MNPYLLSGLGEDFSLWRLSCSHVVGCKTEIWFLKGFMFDFPAFLAGLEYLAVS